MALYKTKGIVLKSRPFDESAKIITVFTKDLGKISVIAKGAKRPTSKFGGRIEPLTLLDMSIAEGRNLDILSQCETIESFRKIKNNPDLLVIALYFLRIINKSLEDRQKNLNLFKLLYIVLSKLENDEDTKDIELYFYVNYLRVEGIFRKDVPPDILIGEHLGEDIRQWKM